MSSKFCSQCGWASDPSDLQTAEAKVTADVAEGQRLFGENRIIEASALAETILLADPDNVPALALKGDCLERSGDIEGALQSYEHVVTLKPDSPLDRIRVAQLRRLAMAAPEITLDRPTRKYNLLAGIAAFVLLTSTGSALILATKKENTTADVVPKVENNVKSTPFTSPAPVPTQNRESTQTQNNGLTNRSDGTSEQAQDRDGTNRLPATGGSSRVSTGRSVPFGGTRLPGPDDHGYRPVDIQVVPEGNNPSKATTTNSDPDPAPIDPKTTTDPEKTTERPPIIDIRPSQGGNKAVGGSQSREDNGNEATTLIRVARQYFLAGDYDKAAKAYEKAIKLGASTASANHRLAQCYLNLRKRPEALAAYQKALGGYQRMVDDGVGDKRLVETYIEECRTAIKLLQ